VSVGRAAFHPFALAQRGILAGRLLFMVFALLIAQFFRLQVIEHSRYRLKSESNRLRPIPLPAPRGVILDRRGRVIAENVPGYSVLLLAYHADSLDRMLAQLQPLIGLDSEQIRTILARHRAAPYEPTLVVKDAPFDLVSRLEERRSMLPGLVIQTEPKRAYPDSTAVAHLVGYVGEVTEAELATPAYSERRPGAIVGKTGLEREYEDSLQGSDGERFVEVDALGRVVREEGAAALPTVSGRDLHTTIDLDLQRYIDSIWPRKFRGAMIAMEPTTGAILALYSYPAYNPNDFVGGISRETWAALNDDPIKPLLNRAIGTRYPPGSTFKLATALMALKRGLVRFDTHMAVPCRGFYQFGNRAFHCWDPRGHGSLDLIGAIANSCDVYFYQLGIRIGVANFIESGSALGFHNLTGVDLPGEIPSSFPVTSDYYDRIYGKGRWTHSAIPLNLAIGQGENAQTLINMVRFYATLGNGGHPPTPYIVEAQRPAPPAIDLPDTMFAGLRNALFMVVEKGTAHGSRIASIQMGGKTGTAQNMHGANHGWFIGFAPYDKPKIVIGGIMEFGGHGTAVAPLVSKAIARYLLGPDSAIDHSTRPLFRLPEDSVLPPPVDTMLMPPRRDTGIAKRPIAGGTH
jgi:penicillin-binding protein 2